MWLLLKKWQNSGGPHSCQAVFRGYSRSDGFPQHAGRRDVFSHCFNSTLCRLMLHRGCWAYPASSCTSFSSLDFWIQLPSFFSAVRTRVVLKTRLLLTSTTHTHTLSGYSGMPEILTWHILVNKRMKHWSWEWLTFWHGAAVFLDVQSEMI